MIEILALIAAMACSIGIFKWALGIGGGSSGGFLFAPFRWLFSLGGGATSLIPKTFDWMFGGEKLSGAQFLSGAEERKILNPRNQGLILDGIGKKRLSLEDSFEHVAVISPAGAGKSSRYIIPNLIGLDDCSVICTDPSGELWEKTSGHMADKGFDVQVLNLADPLHGLSYNPIAKANTYTEIDKLAHVLMRSSNPVVKPGEEIWTDEPKVLLSVLIRCLKNTNEPYWQTLPNLLYLLQNFGKKGEGLINFMRNYCPRNDGGATFNQYQGFINSNDKMLSSFMTVARNALQIVNNPDIASMLSRDEINFDNLRQRKTAVYLIMPETDADFYRFILNLFYTQFFDSQKQLQYCNQGFPIHVLLDEFGHGNIAGFETIATTIRKYRVSLSIVLQDFAQLRKQYGDDGANTILSGGMRSKIFYSGLDTETSEMVEKMLGKVVVKEKRRGHKNRHEENLMNADRIRRIHPDEALCLMSNKEPVLLQTTPSFLNPSMKRALNRPPVAFPSPLVGGTPKYVPLT